MTVPEAFVRGVYRPAVSIYLPEPGLDRNDRWLKKLQSNAARAIAKSPPNSLYSEEFADTQ